MIELGHLMTAAEFETWLERAAPGERIAYFIGEMARFRGDVDFVNRNGRRLNENYAETKKLIDLVRSHGTPVGREVYRRHERQAPQEVALGTGKGRMYQKRCGQHRFEYLFEKAR